MYTGENGRKQGQHVRAVQDRFFQESKKKRQKKKKKKEESPRGTSEGLRGFEWFYPPF